MAPGALMRGFCDSVPSLRTFNTDVSRPGPSGSFPATFSVPKVSCKYCPSVASSFTYGPTVCFPSGASLVKQDAFVNGIPGDSCRSSRLPEHWIEDCVSEIVKHIHEAPFLQMLFNHDNALTVTMSQPQRVPVSPSLSAEKRWKAMKSHVDVASPDAVILVHDLGRSNEEDFVVNERVTVQGTPKAGNQEDMNTGARSWGVLVVGKTIAECSCYILETTRVVSSVGTCTHFCLRKARTFGPSWMDQIRNGWLL